MLTQNVLDILGPPQSALNAAAVKRGTRKEKRELTVSYDFDTNRTPTGCLHCQMSDGFHWPGCPSEFPALSVSGMPLRSF